MFPSINPKSFELSLSETIDWLKKFGNTVANGPLTLD
jgi:hypothetical protein